MPWDGVVRKGEVGAALLEFGDGVVIPSAFVLPSLLPLRGFGGGVWGCCAASIRSSKERDVLSVEVDFARAGVFGEGLLLAFGARGGDAGVAGSGLGA